MRDKLKEFLETYYADERADPSVDVYIDWGFLRMFDEDLADYYRHYPIAARNYLEQHVGKEEKVYLKRFPDDPVPVGELDGRLANVIGSIEVISTVETVISEMYVQCVDCKVLYAKSRGDDECLSCGSDVRETRYRSPKIRQQRFQIDDGSSLLTAKVEGGLVSQVETGIQVKLTGVMDDVFRVHGLTQVDA